MPYQRKYKYEKDIFGKKHRRYFLENVLAADIHDMKTFRALKVKLHRDYLGFFQKLNKIYKKGEFRDLVTDSISQINRSVNLIDSIVDSGTMDKKDVDEIIKNVSEVNAKKDLLVEKAEEAQPLKTSLKGVEESTGIRPENLNVTEKIIRGGARRETKKRKEGILPFVKRTAPRTLGLAGELAGGLGTAALGPFAPLAKIAGGLAGDIFGVGQGLLQKVEEGRERRLGRMLSPFAAGVPRPEIERMRYGRGRDVASRAAVGYQKSSASKVLMDFFNRGAYKAKWTKELLKKMKGLFSKGKGEGVIGNLIDKLKMFGSGLSSFLGTGGKLALVGGAAFLAGERVKTLGEKVGEYITVLGTARNEVEKYSKLQARAYERLRGALGEKIATARKKGDITEAKVQMGYVQSMEQERAKGEAKKMGWRETWMLGAKSLLESPSKSFLLGGGKATGFTPEQMASAGITDPGERLREYSQMQKSIASQISSPKTEELLSAINKLDESVMGLSKEVGRTKEMSPTREPGIGNMFDAGDPLTRSLSESDIDLGM